MNKTFENLVHNKYRMNLEDLGGEVLGTHWAEELSRPINVTQFEINQDLQRLASTFPIEVIPYKSQTDAVIEKLEAKCKKITIKKLGI